MCTVIQIRIYMKRLNLLIIGILIFLTSCSRSPERILSQIWGLNVRGLEHHTEFCTDEWCLNGDGLIEIKMKVDLPQIDIDSLISKGAKPLPLKEPTDTSIWAEDTNSWLERISGIKGATNGVYFYEPGHQEPHESEFLIYDIDSQTLYYRLSIM